MYMQIPKRNCSRNWCDWRTDSTRKWTSPRAKSINWRKNWATLEAQSSLWNVTWIRWTTMWCCCCCVNRHSMTNVPRLPITNRLHQVMKPLLFPIASWNAFLTYFHSRLKVWWWANRIWCPVRVPRLVQPIPPSNQVITTSIPTAQMSVMPRFTSTVTWAQVTLDPFDCFCFCFWWIIVIISSKFN